MNLFLVALLSVAGVTDDAHEQRLLLSIAWHESGWRWDVAQCDVKGDNGRALGMWQVHTTDTRVCSDFRYAAEVALRRVRMSLDKCSYLPRAERLSLYTSGSCSRGHAASRVRWVE
jgi:hypothetical protein